MGIGQGLRPLTEWFEGTGYAEFGEAGNALLPLVVERCSGFTFPGYNGATCKIQYKGKGYTTRFNSYYRPPNSEVTLYESFSLFPIVDLVCTDGTVIENTIQCGGGLWAKYREVTVQCPVGPLQKLPSDDPCTQSLEAGRGVDVNGACAAGLTPEMQQEAQCLANKIASLGISYPGPTATVRTPAYQAHLREIWEKWEALKEERNPACASRKAEIENHKLSHGLTDEPAESSRHETGEAVDVGNSVARELINRVTTDTSSVQDYVSSPLSNPPACNLRWGGRFRRYDPIHFQLP